MRKPIQKDSKKAVILYGACTVIWTSMVVMDVMDRAYTEDAFLFALKAICVPVWIVVFATTLKRYLANRKKK